MTTLLMTDSYKKCENYKNARQNVKGWHIIKPAESGASVYRKKSTTVGGNKDQIPKINRHGQTSRNGWIGKNGFNQHT